jgi:hypothetical protein
MLVQLQSDIAAVGLSYLMMPSLLRPCSIDDVMINEYITIGVIGIWRGKLKYKENTCPSATFSSCMT